MSGRRILMVLMGLEIGGAETHVVELSKELKHQGYDVAVVSNGGVYVAELEAAGIRHHQAPLHKRSPLLMLRSLQRLRAIIRQERPDVVHAHARIPAFLCGILQKQMGFPFVTSAHWVFRTGGALTFLTNWGQETVAVSEDIKAYLMENYGIKPEHIIVTINGIDTEKFSPQVSGAEVFQEFGLDPEKPTISYVSRLDESRALVARQLIELAPKLAKSLPGLQIIITGGGDVFQELKERADQVNTQLGAPCLTLTDARTDVNKIVAAGNLFIGVSRAALEAMAGAKPVIVAGNEGYLGLFDQSLLAQAQESNFCCRGCGLPDSEKLERDILRAFALSREEQEALGAYGRQVILEHYSVRRMAEDCLQAYRRVWEKRPPLRVLMSGYYGFNNLGDESILLSIRRRMEALDREVRLTVLSKNPEQTRARYDVDAVPRFHILRVRRAVKTCDLLISGGGSLLQDATSTRSLLYYLSIIHLAIHYHKPVMLYANGIGPVRKPSNRRRVHKVLDRVDLITLREENSLEELKAIGVNRPPMSVTADPVFTVEGIPAGSARALLEEQGIPTDRPLVGVSIRGGNGLEAHMADFARFCDRLAQDRTVVFLLMQLPNDEGISRQAIAAMEHPAYLLRTPYQPEQMMGAIALMDGVVSMRLHTLIFAAKQRVPMVGISYDPKVDAFLAAMGMPSGGSAAQFDGERAFALFQSLMDCRQEQASQLETAAARMEALALENEAQLTHMLDHTK